MIAPRFLQSNSDSPVTLTADWQTAFRDGCIVDVAHLAVLRITGQDASSFLQSQLSCDVSAVANGAHSTFGAYCTAKGRMQASFILWADGNDWLMVLPASISPAIQRRLSMFILRAKVRISQAEELVVIGLAGRDAISSLPLGLPNARLGIARWAEGWAIGLSEERCLIIASMAEAGRIWERAIPSLRTSAEFWMWLDIHQGIPWIVAQTQDQFVPQMVNLEVIGGVSFKKGCYPGQEIVARTQYLGKMKRRMYLAHVDAMADAGMPLHSDDVAGQNNGLVVNAVPAPGGGTDLLASVQSDSMESVVHLGTPQGPKLVFGSLPYEIR